MNFAATNESVAARMEGVAATNEGVPVTVLVTGGAGYIASHTVLLLLQNNYKVVVVDSCSNCAPPNESSLPPSLERVKHLCGGRAPLFYRRDLTRVEDLSSIFEENNIDAVIHFAALKGVGESVREPLLYYRNNLLSTMNLLKAMKTSGVYQLIFSSSATVYGTPQKLPLDESHPVGENITNPYGQSKYMSEKILVDVTKADKRWSVILLRYFNPVGAHESGAIGEDPVGEPNNLVPYIAQVAIGKREKLKVFGSDFNTRDGTGIRDYIHVMDLSEGHVSALTHMRSKNFKGGSEVYNLGTGRGVSVKEMISQFEISSGCKIKYEVEGRRAGDCSEVVASSVKAEQELHWRATRTLAQMCQF